MLHVVGCSPMLSVRSVGHPTVMKSTSSCANELKPARTNSRHWRVRVKQERLKLLERACRAYFFDIQQTIALLLLFELDRTRESALVLLFNKITQRDKLYSVINVFSQSNRLNLHQRLGPWWFLNKDCPSGKYWLDLGKNNDVQTIKHLLDYQKQFPHTTHFRDVRFAPSAAQPLVQHQVCLLTPTAQSCCHAYACCLCWGPVPDKVAAGGKVRTRCANTNDEIIEHRLSTTSWSQTRRAGNACHSKASSSSTLSMTK